MMNMFEMLQQAQNGEAVKNLSQQFGLNEQQTQQAMGALMPAFNEAMRRNATSMEQMQKFWGDMSQRNMQQFYENADAMRRDDVWMQGNDVLGGLFGSKDLSRAVADQASMMSGLGSPILKQMLPVMAAMLMGGLQRQGPTSNPIEAMMKQMMGQNAGFGNGFGGADNAFGGPLAEMFEKMMGGGATPGMGPSGMGQNPMTDSPMGAFVEGMLNRLKDRAGEPIDLPDTASGTPDGAPADNPNPFDPGELIDALFNAGKKTQDANTEAMGRIFEQFMGAGPKR